MSYGMRIIASDMQPRSSLPFYQFLHYICSPPNNIRYELRHARVDFKNPRPGKYSPHLTTLVWYPFSITLPRLILLQQSPWWMSSTQPAGPGLVLVLFHTLFKECNPPVHTFDITLVDNQTVSFNHPHLELRERVSDCCGVFSDHPR